MSDSPNGDSRMVDLIQTDERDEVRWRHPEPVLIMQHHTQLYGPAGDQSLRRFKSRDSEHWYFFSRSGRAVARIEPRLLARVLAGISE